MVFEVLGTTGPLGSIPPFRSFESRRFGKSEATTHGPSTPSAKNRTPRWVGSTR